MVNLVHTIVDMIVRSIVFAVPVALLAQWCEVQFTWKTVAFVAFCIVWAGCVEPSQDRSRSSSGPDDPSAARKRRTAADVLTRAQVAAEAQKLTPRPSR
jgi:hypothetical protein